MIPYNIIKRFIDISLSSILLIILSPIMLTIYILIFLNYGPPVIFTQERSSRNRKIFLIKKFRTMSLNSQNTAKLTMGLTDNRITKIGKILRKFRMDEIPQLINVIKGEMSLVGPRPLLPEHAKFYSDSVMSLSPGITGLGSIIYAKKEHELLSQVDPQDIESVYISRIMPRKNRVEEMYSKNKSFLLDIKIILKTIKFLIHESTR